MELAGKSDFALTAVVHALVLPLFSAPATGIGRRGRGIEKGCLRTGSRSNCFVVGYDASRTRRKHAGDFH